MPLCERRSYCFAGGLQRDSAIADSATVPVPIKVDGYVSSAGPSQFAHRPAGVPDLGHVVDLVAFERHDIDVVGGGAFACGWQRTALASMGAVEHGVGADAGTLG